MAMSTRRLLRANITGATGSDEADTFEDEPRALGGGGHLWLQRQTSPPTTSLGKTTVCLTFSPVKSSC